MGHQVVAVLIPGVVEAVVIDQKEEPFDELKRVLGDVTNCCEACGSEKLEEWAESGHYWMHCHDCDHDHEDHFVN